jgi:DHA1 family bicyclomycin/chloramphenicol resistance-like MFS transporter
MTAIPAELAETAVPLARPYNRTKMFILLGALTSAGPLAVDLYLPALPQLARDLGASAPEAQLSLTSFMIGLGSGQVITGPLSDAFGRKRPLLIGLGAFAVLSLLCAFSRSIEILIFLRLLQGLTAATGVALTKAVVRDLYSGVAAAKFFTMLMLVTGLIPLLAPVLGAQLLRVTPWPGMFAVMAAFGAIMLVTALITLPETHPPALRVSNSPRAVLSSLWAVGSDRRFLAFTLTAGFASGAQFCYLSGSSFVLQDVYGLSPQSYSLLFSVNAIGMMITGQLAGRLAGRVPMGRLLMAGLSISAVASVAVLVGVLAGLGLPVVSPSLFFMVAGQGLIYPMALTLAMSSQPTYRAGSASALFGLVQWTFGGLTGPISGAFGTSTALPLAITVTVLGAAGCLCGGLLLRASAE